MGVSNAARRVGAALACACTLAGAAWAADAPAGGASAAAAPAAATRLEDYHLLALSSSEGVAVLRAPDRRLITLKIGATLPGARARLAQVLADRLRFETVDATGLRQTAWMIRTGGPEQLPEVQRVSAVGPARPAAANAGRPVVTPLGGAPTAR